MSQKDNFKAIFAIFRVVLLAGLLLAGGGWLLHANVALAGAPAAPAAGTCYVETTGDNTTDGSSADASALQNAINAADPDDVIKVAGTCAGVQQTAGLTQTAYISQNLTLRGGYTVTNWLADPDPNAYPTVLDAQGLGRVVVITGTAAAQVEYLIITGGSASVGAGFYVDTGASLNLYNSQVISNTATGISLTDGGGGLGNLGQTVISGTTFSHNSAVISAGGAGNGPGGTLTVENSSFSFNSAHTAGGLGSTGQVTITTSSFFSNTVADTGAAIGNAQAFGGSGWMQIQASSFMSNIAAHNGGAIDNDGGEMHLSDSIFIGNAANGGGALYNNSTLSGLAPTLYITDSTFISNTAGGNGGALRNRTGQATIEGSTFTGNASGGAGGAIQVVSGSTVNINHSTLSYNTAVARGGAVLNSGDLNLNGTTIAYNSAQQNGGGVENDTGDTLTVINSTIVTNTAVLGGGVNNAGTFTLTNSTISGNAATSGGGGLNNLGASSNLSLTHTTVTSNIAPLGAGLVITNSATLQTAASILSGNSGANDCDSGSATLQSNGYNLLGSGCAFATGSDISTTSPGLAPLADNGGGTWTHALLPGSSALDAIPVGSCLLNEDQRGVSRPQGIGCDIGSYEEVSLPIYYTKSIATGAGNCTSWANACTLLTALSIAATDSEIWVMTGVYTPGLTRSDTFQLVSGVGVYGGFAGTETARDQRDPGANLTVLSGDIDGDDSQTPVITDLTTVTGNTNNSYHVVTGNSTISTTVLDGFVISAGYANGGSTNNFGGGWYNNGGNPTLMNVIFSGNFGNTGGGMYNYSSSSPNLTNVTFSGNAALFGGGMGNQTDSSPSLTNVTFSGNAATYSGGGMRSQTNSSPSLTNVTFSSNSADDGGGMYNYASSSPSLINVTFSGNTATTNGGGMSNYSSSPVIRNTILWGNTAGAGAQVYNMSSTPLIRYSVVQGGCPASSNCANLISADPLLGALTNFGGAGQQVYPLDAASSAIDAGDDANCASTDQRGVTRPQGGQCDIGAFEVQDFVVDTLADENDGSCTDGDCSLRDAMDTADDGTTITFSVSGTITLGSALPQITQTLTIDGAGQAVAVDGADTYIIFDVSNIGVVFLNALTVQHGYSTVYAGGITNEGSLTVTNSTIANNSGVYGGGIRNGGDLTVINSTLTGNLAAYGGGIENDSSGTLTVIHSTVSGNGADFSGGGIYHSSGTWHLSNTILANSTSAEDCYNGAGDTIATNINNLIETNGAAGHMCGTPALTTDPDLGLLADNGGDTQTMSLPPGSPAIDAGNDAACPVDDQRGIARPQGSHCDLGAYESEYFTLTVTLDGNGSVTSDPAGIDCGVDCTENLVDGTTITLTATADTHHLFTNWSGACSGTGDCVVTVDAAKFVTATFTLEQYALTLATDGTGSGSITADPDQPLYDYGTVVTLTATADTGSTFDGWSGDLGGTTNPVTLTIMADTAVTATFTLDQHTLTLGTAGNGSGSVTANPDQPLYDYGTVVTLTASTDTGSDFAGWSGDLGGTTNPMTFTIMADTAVTATFTLEQYALTVTTAGNGSGSVSADPNQPLYDYGTVVTLTATADPGSLFTGWSGACSGTGDCVVTMDAAKFVTATFIREEVNYFIFLPVIAKP